MIVSRETKRFEPPPECPKCDGLGFILNTATKPRKCRTCHGTGQAPQTRPARRRARPVQ